MQVASFRPTSRTTWLGIILVILLIVLGTLQFTWIDRVSEVEKQRRQALLSQAAQRLASDFDAELTRLQIFFQRRTNRGNELEEVLQNSYERWVEEQVYGGLLRQIYLLPVRSGDERRDWELRRYVPSERKFEATSWPVPLEPLRERFREAARGGFPGAARSLRPFDGAVPAILVPLLPLQEGRPRLPIDALLILELDEQFIRDVFLPELASRYFGVGLDSEFRLWVRDRLEGTLQFHWPDSEGASIPDRVDVQYPLFAVHPGRPGAGGPGPGGGRGRRMRSPGSADPLFGPRPPEGDWELLVVHRAGSVEAAVNVVKFWNLFITTAILAILAISIVVTISSAQRARQLARQQMDFVAGVSHELRTPLTAIRSAAQNLRDGVVSGRQEVANYGRIISKAESRLHGMVMQVLDFARSQSNPRDQLEKVDLVEVIQDVIEELRPAFPPHASEPSLRIQDPLPGVVASRHGLRRVLENLIQNALKYSSESVQIEIEATSKGRHVLVRVKDNGPGVPEEELKHIFEPFYRGKAAQESQIQGSGLGLSLVKSIVESFGGKVGVESRPGEGSVFWVQLDRIEEES